MNADIFRRTFNVVPSRSNVVQYRIRVRRDAGLDDILEAAKRCGIPVGNFNCGVFEVQTDVGIWSNPTGKNLRFAKPANRVFKSWEQLEAEEA